MKLILASNNRHKLEEIRAILGDHFSDILSMAEAGIVHETVEDGKTFVIKDESSKVYKRQCVCKRVQVRDGDAVLNRDVLIQLSVQNLEDYFDYSL